VLRAKRWRQLHASTSLCRSTPIAGIRAIPLGATIPHSGPQVKRLEDCAVSPGRFYLEVSCTRPSWSWAVEIAGFCRFLPGIWRWGARARVIGIGFVCAGLGLGGGGVGLLVKVVGHDLATGIGGDYVAQEGMGDLAGALPLHDIGRRRQNWTASRNGGFWAAKENRESCTDCSAACRRTALSGDTQGQCSPCGVADSTPGGIGTTGPHSTLTCSLRQRCCFYSGAFGEPLSQPTQRRDRSLLGLIPRRYS